MSDVQPGEIHPPAEQRAEDQAVAREDGPRCPLCRHYADHLHPIPLPTWAGVVTGTCDDCGWCEGELARVEGKSILREMTRDVEPYADAVDVFGLPRTEPPSPAEAHEIMQRVTGQPEYMGSAELSARYAKQMREALSTARLPISSEVTADDLLSVPPFKGWREAATCKCPDAARQMHLADCQHWYGRNPATPAPIAPCGCTNVTKCRAHGYPKSSFAQWYNAGITPVDLPTPSFNVELADQVSTLIGDAAVQRAKDDEESLRAMGAKGDGQDMLFEMQPAAGLLGPDTLRLRVLARAKGLPEVAVESTLDRAALDRWVPLAEEIGKAMMDCAARIRAAMAAWQAMFDAVADAPTEDGETS